MKKSIQILDNKQLIIIFNKRHYLINKRYLLKCYKETEFLPGIYLKSHFHLLRKPILEIRIENKRDSIILYKKRKNYSNLLYNSKGIKQSHSKPMSTDDKKNSKVLIQSIHYPSYPIQSCPLKHLFENKSFIGNDTYKSSDYHFLTYEEAMLLPDFCPQMKMICQNSCIKKRAKFNNEVRFQELDESIMLKAYEDDTVHVEEGRDDICFLKRFNKNPEETYVVPQYQKLDFTFDIHNYIYRVFSEKEAKQITNSFYTRLQEYHLSNEVGHDILKGKKSIQEIYELFE